MTKSIKTGLIGATALSLLAMTGAANAAAHGITACLITKTDTNPFFVKMKEGATAKAEEMGITLKTYAGKIDGDHETQVQAIETCIADGAMGILLTASDTSSIVTSVQQARDAGLLVIALDTPLEPIDAADATFATDNFLAGELIGKWAAGKMGDMAGDAKIGMLDLAISQPSVGVLRDQGFLQGFGIDLVDPNKWGDETDPRIIGHDVTAGNEEGGRRAMENLLAIDADINVVYTINEPAAAGAYEALKSIGREGDVLIVSKLDRLARSVPDARAIAEQLEKKGVKLALGASVYDPTDPMGRMFFNILATFAEFESDLIRMRTREGMAIARAKGKLRGKQPKLSEKQQKELCRMKETGEYSISDLAEIFSVSRPTIYRCLQRAAAKNTP